MLNKKAKRFRSPSTILIVITVATILAACEFDTSGDVPVLTTCQNYPLAELTSPFDPTKVFEDPGKVVAYRGSGCAKSDKSGEEDCLRVEDSIEVPDYATAATVFLNGWELEYLHGDHEIKALATGIYNIEFGDGTLSWEAVGLLSDKNFDDGYRWCYDYTIIAWNEVLIDASIDHDDDNKIFINEDYGHTTALKVLSSFIQNSDFRSDESIAILPRGYGFRWEGDDRKLLQLAYNLDYSESFIQYEKDYSGDGVPSLPSPASHVDSGFVSWETKTIFKDDDLRRNYDSGEIVSALSGSDVGIVQSPFSLLPREDQGWWMQACLYQPSEKTKEYVIENVPFEYAVPMLTGWELSYDCDAAEVTQIGIWLADFTYDKVPGDSTGTLHYTVSSTLHDQDDTPGLLFNHQVHILGLVPVVGAGEPTAVILNPQTGETFSPDTMITLQGEGIDPEDGVLSASDLLWFSDEDGFLGSGNSIQIALSGPEVACHPEYATHTITLLATDSDGHQSSQQITIRVGAPC